MTDAQQRFIRLHQDHNVVKWKWLFGEMMFRAFSESGQTATISRSELDDLVATGTMRRGVGYSVHLAQEREPVEV